MFCTVYKLRSQGIKWPVEAARAHRMEGWLEVARHGGWPEWHARLLVTRPPPGKILEPIDMIINIRLTHIKGGIMLAGFDKDAKGGSYRQSWWCVPGYRAEAPSVEDIPYQMAADANRSR